MKTSTLKIGDKITFTNEEESRTIEVTQQLLDKFPDTLPSEYSILQLPKNDIK